MHSVTQNKKRADGEVGALLAIVLAV